MFFSNKQKIQIIKVFLNQKELTYRFSLVTKNSNELEIESGVNEIEYKTFESLKTKITNAHPVVLVFLGNDIFYSNNTSFFENNDNTKDLCYTRYLTSSEIEFLAVVREQSIKDVISKFSDNSLYVVDAYIGALTIPMFFSEKGLNKTMSLKTAELLFDTQGLKSIKKKEFIKIENNSIKKNENKLTLSAAASYLHKNNNIKTFFKQISLKKNQSNLKHKALFLKYTKVGGVIFIILFTIGLSLSSFFSNQILKVDNEISSKQDSLLILKGLKKEFNRKEKIFALSGFSQTTSISYLINDIVKVMPKEIKLKKIEVFPLNNTIRPNKKILINNKKINIKGNFADGNDFKNWIKNLNNSININSLNISKFKMNKSITEFEIIIVLNNGKSF